MIPVNETPWEPGLWHAALKQAYRSSRSLLAALGTRHADAAEADDFPVLVPRGFARRMQPGDPDDPLLLQVLAVQAEKQPAAGFVSDPLYETDADAGFSHTPGLIQKYQGRVLLLATGGCAVHCRYCFRRHFPYQAHLDPHLDQALNAVAADTSIREVILSGGDPLLLEDQPLAELINRIARIPHVRRLRIHTRIPIVLPERTTPALLAALQAAPLQLVLVVHANHGRELNTDTERAFGCLRRSGAWLFNQAVLLRGINDTAAAQIQLAERLFEQQVLPYYLHLPDRVAGTHHFFVSRSRGQAIFSDMQAHLPGYLLPRLVEEVPKKASKMIVSSG